MTAPLNLPSLRKVAEEAHVKPHTVPIKEGVRRFLAYVATFDPPTVLALLTLAEHKERLEGIIRAIELNVDTLNTKGFPQKAETQASLDRIKAHCRAALSPELPDGDATHG